MLTLPGQYEFLSEDFMAEGRAFLERETAAIRACRRRERERRGCACAEANRSAVRR